VRQQRRTYCELCADTGRVTVWHQQCLDAYRDLRLHADEGETPTLPRKDHRSCAVACGCGSGAPFRWLPTYSEAVHLFFHTTAADRQMALEQWFEDHFANTVEMRNGSQVADRTSGRERNGA